MRSDVLSTHPTVIPRAGGGSSTPRILDSITDVSEYWMPACAGMTGGHHSAFSRHTAPEVCKFVRPQKMRGRREDRVRAAPAVSCAKMRKAKAHMSIQVQRRASGLPCAMVLTAYSVLSPATNSSCHRHRRIDSATNPVGLMRLRRLDTSNGCQDHTALPYASAPLVLRAPIAHGQSPPCGQPRATTLPRPPHPAPNVRDDGQRPSVRARDSGKYAGDLAFEKSRIFLSEGLDRFLLICPSGCFLMCPAG